VLSRWAWERVGRGKLLLHCRLGGARGFGAHGGEEGRGHIVAAARLQIIGSEVLGGRSNLIEQKSFKSGFKTGR